MLCKYEWTNIGKLTHTWLCLCVCIGGSSYGCLVLGISRLPDFSLCWCKYE